MKNENNPPANQRRRRPSLFGYHQPLLLNSLRVPALLSGQCLHKYLLMPHMFVLYFRKRASYKHKYSSAIAEDDDTIIASQETSDQNNISPSKYVSKSAIPDNDDTGIASQETSEQNNLSLSKSVSQKHSVESHEGQSGSL